MRVLGLTLVLFLAVAAPAQKPSPAPAHNPGIIFWKMSPESVDLLLGSVPQPDEMRLAQLKQTFTDLQCRGANLRVQRFDGGKNLLCTLPGTPLMAEGGTPRITLTTILFIAHYEHSGSGQSAIENWSGALMLPFLFHALSASACHHTFLFAEVDGESGARALFDSFTPVQRRSIQGLVAFDALGLGPAQFYIEPNDTVSSLGWWRLYRPFLQATVDQRLPSPMQGIPGGWYKTDVTREFRYSNIPSMLIHSVGFGTRELPGSERDTSTAIDRDTYDKTILLLSDYAAELDRMSSSPPASAPAAPSRGRHP
jgi:hypothetical protein